ncbi:hypothetical protein B0H14DRAFT_3444601 [Mycena olivaceomarginata]|nr:hypothetical protein B0H14DRAFT_3444601 [Mycena olivaceomarginata]
MHTLDNALNNTLDSAFDNLQLDNNVDFYPRRGFEHTRGSENWYFYVVTRGHVAGIYTHWEEAWLQIDGYKHNAYKKYHGWVAATSAFELGRLPSTSVNARLPNSPAAAVSPSTPSRGLARLPNTAAVAPPSTPPRAQALHVGTQARVPMTPTPARKHVPAPPAPVSAPSTPTGSRKNLLYVYSRGKDTTIYTDSGHASAAARRGLADGSFRKIEVTGNIHDVFDHAEESAWECYNISDSE